MLQESPLTNALRQKVFKEHHAAHAQLCPGAREYYEDVAAQLRIKVATTQADDADHAIAAMELRKTRHQQHLLEQGPHMLLSNCRCNIADHVPETKEPQSKRPRVRQEDLREHLSRSPWLSDYIGHLHGGRESVGPVSAREPRPARCLGELEEDASLEQALQVLADKRNELALQQTHDTQHLSTEVRGGRWTQTFMAVPCDATAAKARASLATSSTPVVTSCVILVWLMGKIRRRKGGLGCSTDSV